MEPRNLKPLVIRADADSRVGLGHVMRCIALAQEWRRRGGEVHLAGSVSIPAAIRLLDQEGIEVLDVQGDDPGRVVELGRRLGSGWVVVDSYTLHPSFADAIRAAGMRVCLIDDLAERSHYDVDLVVNPNPWATEERYQGASRALLGSRYALIRSEFANPSGPARIAADPLRLLVTLGGSVHEELLDQVLDAVAALDMPLTTTVLGPVRSTRSGVISLPIDEHPSAVMRGTDVAISGGGGTAWELAAMGVPFAVVEVATNQSRNVEWLLARRAALSLGRFPIASGPAAAVLRSLVTDADLRIGLAARAYRLIDGLGPRRVASAMTGDEITVRRVTREDAQQLWDWANDPRVRGLSFNPAPIPWDKHVSWLEGRLSLGTPFFLAERGGRPVGQIRYDRAHDAAEISFSVEESSRGQGIGVEMIDLTRFQACRELGVQRVTARALLSNEMSRRVFLRARFQELAREEVDGRPCYRFSWTLDDDHDA